MPHILRPDQDSGASLPGTRIDCSCPSLAVLGHKVSSGGGAMRSNQAVMICPDGLQQPDFCKDVPFIIYLAACYPYHITIVSAVVHCNIVLMLYIEKYIKYTKWIYVGDVQAITWHSKAFSATSCYLVCIYQYITFAG